jgi:hypothetical protein
MSRHAQVYDLGNVDRVIGRPQPRPAPAVAKPRPGRTRAVLADKRVAQLATDVTQSLSVFAPGATQIVQGRFSLGLFYVSALTFVAVLASAVLGTLDRLAPTLELLGHSVAVAFWTLGVAFLLAAAVHLAAVWTGSRPTAGSARPPRHPAVPAVASAILPGWGQVLNGDRVRALLFLFGCWLVAGAWIISSEAAASVLNSYVPAVMPWEQSARAPLVLWTVKWTTPLVVWCLAVYDAATSAAGRR